ncbi:hypothetical protein LXA43DRAFT_1105333 [Ganoderma leucocontextum]|nr:hypothetical protein LXA43DRAFT_1105333 [Ganoderma leucocontextum]
MRALVRDLLELGVSVGQVNDTIAVVARALGVPVEGSLSARSVERIALEGLVAAYCQLAEEIRDADGITASGDGTSYRNTQLESRHIILNTGDSHQRRFLGIHSAPNHTSNTQLEGLKELNAEIFDTYNDSPNGKKNPADPRSFPLKICGMMTDHAEDQKRLGRITLDWKIAVDRELRGEQAVADHSPSDLLLRLAEETARAVEKIGREAWDALTPEELAAQDQEIRRAVHVALGEEAYSQCSDTEKRKIDLFVHAGCCMHKELNAVKGGNTSMMAYWDTTDIAPVLLMNRDNHAAAAAGTSTAQVRAVKRSTGGAVKVTELSGGVFHHRDDRKGQQDAFRYHMEMRTGKPVPHPDTTNIRYQSHCTAAGFLILHYDHVLTYLDEVKDRKTGDGGWNHMEANVARGLRDDPTLTELCVLALYAQAISHPYMREVRCGNGASALSLGPFHEQLKTHLARLIADPDLLLGPNATYKSATLDGQEWKDPDVVYAVRERAQTLPHAKGALVAFLKGALATWERFTAEFARGGVIDRMDAEELKRTHMDKGKRCQ